MNKVNKWIVALAVVLPTLLEIIDTSVVNVSLDHIRGSLSAGLDESTWTLTAYLVSNAIIIPLTGWLSSIFGRKRYLLFSVALFTFSSFLCGSAHSLNALVFFRVLQGIGGGALQPISQAILFETFPPEEYGMAMAIFGVGVMVGPIIGPVLGGWITDTWSWNWIFYINIPIGILCIFMIMLVIQDPPYIKKIRKKIDYWGLILVAVGIGCLQVVLDKGQREDWFASGFIMQFSVVAAVCLVAFVFVELRSPEPVLNLRQFKDLAFASANIIQSAAFFVLFGSILLIPLFVQQLMGYNAFLAGLVLMPGGIASLIAMPIAARLITKVNPKALLISGICITAYSVFLMTQFNLYVDFGIVSLPRVIMGIGLGLLFVPLSTMAFTTIKKEEMGNATSIFSLLRNIAGSFGIAFMTTLLARRSQFHLARFGEQATPLDLHYQVGVHRAMNALAANPAAGGQAAANGVIYQQLMRQARLFSFTDAFHAASLILICIIPLVFLLKRPKGAGEVMIH